MCSSWAQKTFIDAVYRVLLEVANNADIVEQPDKELTPLSEPLYLGPYRYILCFLTRYPNNKQSPRLQQGCFSSATAKIESMPRMNSGEGSMLAHFGLPCAIVLYTCVHNVPVPIMGRVSHTPVSDSAQKPPESVLQTLEYCVYTAAVKTNMQHTYPFLVQVPIYTGGNVQTVACRGWHKSSHFSGLINGCGLASSFGFRGMRPCDCDDTAGQDRDSSATHQHQSDSFTSKNVKLTLQDSVLATQNTSRKASKHSHGPIPLLSYYYMDMLPGRNEEELRNAKLPYNTRLIPIHKYKPSNISLANLRDLVTDAFGSSKSQHKESTKNTVKTTLNVLVKALKSDYNEILWPLKDALPTDKANNAYIDMAHPTDCSCPIKSQLSTTLSRIVPIHFPSLASISKMYLNGLVDKIPHNFGSAWKIFAHLPPEAFVRGKAIESVALHWYGYNFKQRFIESCQRMIYKMQQSLESAGSLLIFGAKLVKSRSLPVKGNKGSLIVATNTESYDYRVAPLRKHEDSHGHQSLSPAKYRKKLFEYKQARVNEYKHAFALIFRTNFPFLLPIGLMLRNPLHTLSVANHFGLAAIESFGSEKADIDEAPVWIFSALLDELNTVDDYDGVVSGCTAMIRLLRNTKDHLSGNKLSRYTPGCITSIVTIREEPVRLVTHCYYPHVNVSMQSSGAPQSRHTERDGHREELYTIENDALLTNIVNYVLGKYLGITDDDDDAADLKRKGAPFKAVPYYSTGLSFKFFTLHTERSCPENCVLCRLARVAHSIIDTNGILKLIKAFSTQCQSMFRATEPIPYTEYTFDILRSNILYQSIVRANQCLKLYLVSNDSRTSTSFEESIQTLVSLRISKVTLSLPSPTFTDLIYELSADPSKTVLYSLLCKNFLQFMLQSGLQIFKQATKEKDLTVKVLDYLMARGDYAGYADAELVSIYPKLCTSVPYTSTPSILTEEALAVVPIGRPIGMLTFIPKRNTVQSQYTPYLCLVYPYPNHLVEHCVHLVTQVYTEIKKKDPKRHPLEMLQQLRDTVPDQDFYDIGLTELKKLNAPEHSNYLLYSLASIHAINYTIDVAEASFELLSEQSIFDALVNDSFNTDIEGEAACDNTVKLLDNKLLDGEGPSLLSPIALYAAQGSSFWPCTTTLLNCITTIERDCAKYYRKEYIVACSLLLSDILEIPLSVAYSMCLQPVALDPGERDVAFRRIEKYMVPLFWEATLLTSFNTGRDTQHHRCYMQFLNPHLQEHTFTPTFQQCIALTLLSAVTSKKHG